MTCYSCFTSQTNICCIQVALDYGCDFSLVLDLRRAKILVRDFSQMDAVVTALMALGAAEGTIVIVSVKNRIGKRRQRPL